MSNGKVMIIHLTVGLSYFPYSHSKSKLEVKLNLSNFATKSDLKIAAGFDTSQFSKK